MAISDKEAFRILDLPLGVDKDAINQRYRSLSSKLAASKVLEDVKKLEKVVQAFHQLLPPSQNKSRHNNMQATRSSHRANDDAANLSAMHALQRKAEKKKEKKKRKKEKRKNNDKSENKFMSNNGKIGGEDSDCSSYEADGDEDPIDINSAFAGLGRKVATSNGATGGAARKLPSPDNQTNTDPEVLINRQAQARGMAVQGNEAASQGLHQKAVKLFTQAATFDPTDHRFLGNRSFCYEQLKLFDKALNDADKAIQLSPDWPKGYFRRGRALIGLGQLTEGEEAFSRVLQLDPECQEAQEEISNVQRTRLTEMGFTQEQAVQAISKYQQVQAALDALLAGEFHDATSNIFYSEGEESDTAEPVRVFISAASLPKKTAPNADDVKMNPRNPHGLTSLWVGNVLPEVTEKELQKLFSKFGHVSSVRQLKEKFCAFVNFSDSTSAGRAMTGLQGHSVSGQRLLIKFPDNPITSNTATGGARRRNTAATNSIAPTTHGNGRPESSASSSGCGGGNDSIESNGNDCLSKLRGPVYGDECYFWRTTGCAFVDTCRHKHVLSHKGIDRKPWQK